MAESNLLKDTIPVVWEKWNKPKHQAWDYGWCLG